MAIALVSSVSLAPSGNDGGTSAAIDTTGATLLIVSLGNAFVNVPTLTDSKGNTWITLTLHSSGSGRHRLRYCLTPNVGTGHTFTIGGTDIYGAAIVYAFSGVGSYQTESGNAISTNSPPIASGSVTPSMDGALIFAGLGANDPATDSLSPGGFTLTTIPNAANVSLQNTAAYLIQSTAAAVNPTWSWTGGSHAFTAVSTAVFLPAFDSGGVRVTQAAADLLTVPPRDLLVTQAAVEILGSTVATETTAIRVTQAPVEVLAAAPVAAQITQYAVELLHTQLPIGWKVIIDGIDRTAIVDQASCTFVLNERARASLTLGDFIPDKFDEVIFYAKDGTTKIFGGVILTRTFTGRNQYDPTFTVAVDCGDYFTYADWTHATVKYDAPTLLKTVLQDLVDDYLGAYGIGLYPGQLDGPLLDPFTWTEKKISEGLRELAEKTGWVAQLTAAKRLRMFLPATETAPFQITESTPNCQELSWTDTDRLPANTVKVIAGPTGQREIHDERHYGDGVTRVFPLYSPFVAIIGALSIFSEGAGGYPVAWCGLHSPPGEPGADYPYCYDSDLNAIRQRSDQPVIAAGDYFWIWYLAEFPFQVSAVCEESTAPLPIEHVERREDVLSIPAAQQIADGLAAAFCSQPREILITTDFDGLEVGQVITIDLPVTRSISIPACLITEVAFTIVQDTDPAGSLDAYWVYTVKALESVTYQGSYLDEWRRLTGLIPPPADRTVDPDTPPPPPEEGLMMLAAPPVVYLGGSRGVSVSAGPVAWQPVINFVIYTAPADFTAQVRVELAALEAGVGVQARLYNVTTGAPVAPASEVITATALTPTTFTVALVAGESYRLEVIGTVADASVFAIGTLEEVATDEYRYSLRYHPGKYRHL